MGIGPWEIAGIVVIVLVIFGAGRLAGVGKALGQGVREFREEARNPSTDEDELADGEEESDEGEAVASSSGSGSEARADKPGKQDDA